MGHPKTKLLLSTALITLAISPAFAADVTPATPTGQSSSESRQVTVSIPAQRLADSLRQLAETSGLQLVYDAKLVEGKTAPAVNGTMTRRSAITTLLAGSGLEFNFSGDRTVILTASAGGNVRSVGVVSVSGIGNSMPFGAMVSATNGINGSRDVEATEGTGSYTTGALSVASKTPLAMRDTPLSVSVMTAQQIKDQNLISAKEVFENIAGLNVAAGGTGEEFEVSSRGFKVSSFAFDGGAPLSTNKANRPVLNMAEFDSVQLVRGAAGLFAGYDDPSGVVNLIRKKPLDQNQLTYSQDIGSYQNYREVLDITGPLNEDRTLRARGVYSQQDNKFHYDLAEAHKKLLYGIVEYDLTPQTLLTAGASYIREDNLPNQSGLPRYSNGEAIDWPTSTCICLPFARDNPRKLESFMSVNHEFNEDWSAKLSYTHINQSVDATYYAFLSNTPLIKGERTAGYITGYVSKSQMESSGLELLTTGKFQLFGREQSVVVGANFQLVDESGGTTIDLDSTQRLPVPDVLNFNPYAYSEPVFGTPSYVVTKSKSTRYGAYANLRLSPIDDVHVTFGLRYNVLVLDAIFSYPTSDFVQIFPDLKDRSTAKPTIGITYDFLKYYTAYASYQSIYQPQYGSRSVKSTEVPPPVTGINTEWGLKWASPDKKMNAALSVYYITQNGFLTTDYNSTYDPETDSYSGYQSLIQDYKSQGADLELTGEVFPGLQASMNYSYSTSTKVTQSATSPRTSYLPRNTFKAWLMYRGGEGGPIGRTIIGAGINARSSAYTSGFGCTAANSTGNCSYGPFEFKTSGYATLSAKIGYVFSQNIEASLKLDNITNVRKYQPSEFQSLTSYNYYTAPFSAMATVNFKY